MQQRPLGKTGRTVSEVGLGTWQIGGGWGDVSPADAIATLKAAYDQGVTFFDTADVYGAGRSESFIGEFLREIGPDERVLVATKLGRRGDPGWPGNFSREAVRAHTEDSLQRLGVEALDLTQLHCVPSEVLANGEVFGWLDELKGEGKIKAYGASVESMAEAETCIAHGGCASLQIIFNIFRQKPIHALFARARAENVGLIVRLPLASGLLAGKMSRATTFAADDHRNFNRDGQSFNVGETFAGLPFELGVDLAEQIRPLVPAGMTMAQCALRWCLDFAAVSAIIPGARNPAQAEANAAVAALPALDAELQVKLAHLYETAVRDHIRGPY